MSNLSLLKALANLPDEDLQQSLLHLQTVEFLQESERAPEPVYAFKHILTQEAVYASLLAGTRQHYHQQIATLLHAQFADTAAAQPERLAYHYTQADQGEQALPWWIQAGKQAVQRWAYVEAIEHCTQGLELLQQLPRTSNSHQSELEMLLILGEALMQTQGDSASETGHVYARAMTLCQQVGNPQQQFRALAGLRQFYTNRDELQTAQQMGSQLLALGERLQDTDIQQEAHRSLGALLFDLGDLRTARLHLDQGIALVDHHRAQTLYRSLYSRAYLARLLWVLGYPSQALQNAHDALTQARAAFHPPTLAMVMFYTAWLHASRRDVQAVDELSEEVLDLTTKWGLSLWLADSKIIRGWALYAQGQIEAGIHLIQEGWQARQSMVATHQRPVVLGALAHMYRRSGQQQAGLRTLNEAFTAVEQSGHHWYAAELYRCQGDLLMLTDPTHPTDPTGASAPAVEPAYSEAEAAFQQAIALDRHQQAKTWELRASISLARLWQQQGRTDGARQVLTSIYTWFTEGFDTADLKEAKALLTELGA